MVIIQVCLTESDKSLFKYSPVGGRTEVVMGRTRQTVSSLKMKRSMWDGMQASVCCKRALGQQPVRNKEQDPSLQLQGTQFYHHLESRGQHTKPKAPSLQPDIGVLTHSDTILRCSSEGDENSKTLILKRIINTKGCYIKPSLVGS